MNMCEKFHYDPLRNDRALGNGKSDNNKNNNNNNRKNNVGSALIPVFGSNQCLASNYDVTTCCRSDRATLSTTVAVDDRRTLPLWVVRGTATLVDRARTPDDDPAATGTAAAGIVVDAMRCRATTTDWAAASGAITADRGSGDSGDGGSSSSWLQVEVDARSSPPTAIGSRRAATSLAVVAPSHVGDVGWTRLTVVDSAMDPSSFTVSVGYYWRRTTDKLTDHSAVVVVTIVL